MEEVALSSTWADGPVVVVFQRYYGCPFCQLQVAQLAHEHDRFKDLGASVVLIGHGERDATKLTKAFSDFKVLFDPDLAAYEAFGLGRGTLMQVAGPRLWAPMAKANLTPGVRQGGVQGGDYFQLPGTFIVNAEGIITYAHRNVTAADFPVNDVVVAALRRL